MSNDEFVYPAADEDEPLVGEPIVDKRYEHHKSGTDGVTIYDAKNPFAWIQSDEAIEFGGER